MDSKITLSFDTNVINKAKRYAEEKNISVSRLVEMLLDKATTTNYQSLEDYPVADWVNMMVAEQPAAYLTKKSTKRKRNLRKDGIVHPSNRPFVMRLLRLK